VVGDDDQSIYGWRGAEVSNILEFEQHFPNPTVVKLEQNYRSTSAILTTANAVITNNPRRRAKKLWSDKGEGERVRVIRMPDDRKEAEFVTDDINRLRIISGEPWENFAVLFRMNAQSRLLEQNLRQRQIPYRIVGARSFFDRREVKDVLAYARVLVNPDDDASLLRIINTPSRGISGATCERALEASVEKKCSIHRVLHDGEFTGSLGPKAAGSIRHFLEVLDVYETRLMAPFADFSKILGDLVGETGYLAEVKRLSKTPDEALERETAVREVLGDMTQYQQRTREGLREFLDSISLEREREEEDIEKKKGVTLLTLHAAKGLEFPTVFLIGLEEGVLPHDRSKLEGTLDEERRLLYVGITRAMTSLTISHCHSRMKFGSVSPCHPSSFIKELPAETTEHTDLATLMNRPATKENVRASFAAMKAAILNA
jgi:superfamily I DNA/RNA helicase